MPADVGLAEEEGANRIKPPVLDGKEDHAQMDDVYILQMLGKPRGLAPALASNDLGANVSINVLPWTPHLPSSKPWCQQPSPANRKQMVFGERVNVCT